MHAGQIFVYVLAVVIIVAFGATWYYFSTFGEEGGLPSIASLPPRPEVAIEEGGEGHAVIRWENLPEDTGRIDIFRKLIGTGNPEKWKVVSTGGETAGSVDLILEAEGPLTSYTFSFEAISTLGGLLWSSESAGGSVESQVGALTGTPPASGSDQAGGGVGTSDGSMSGNSSAVTATSSDGTTGDSTVSSNGSSTTTADGVEPVVIEGYYFYNPQGQVSGIMPFGTNPFWVQHVDRRIEVGWSNLPEDTDMVRIARAQTEEGPFKVVLEQQNPVLDEAYAIRFVDGTLFESYYYTLDALAGGEVRVVYGPLLLEALAE